MNVIAWIVYVVITLCLAGFPVGLLMGVVATNRSNMISEIVRVVYYVALSVWFWVSPDARPEFVGAFLIGVLALDVQETITSAIFGVEASFRNKGTSLRERRVRLWLNAFSLGKFVKAVRFAMVYGGNQRPVFVSVDFSDDRTADGRYVNDNLPALVTSLVIRSNIKALLRL